MAISYQAEKTENNKFSKKDEILKKATHLFREKGYASSSVRDIAMEVGIEAPSIYSHFRSKEHILQEICFEMARAFMMGLERAEVEESPQKQLMKVIREHLEVVIYNKEASSVMWNEWKFLTEPSLSKFHTLKKNYEKRFEKIIQKGITLNVFRKTDSRITANLLLSSLNSLVHWHKNGQKSKIILEKELTELYFKGILK